MNPLLLTGTALVFIALVCYTLSIRLERKQQLISVQLLRTFSTGLFFDISATSCMIAGSSNSPFTIHGFIGYSALLLMCIDFILLWRLLKKNGVNTSIPNSLHRYTLLAYCWWIAAFISGGIIAGINS
jgi:hypothetical protein